MTRDESNKAVRAGREWQLIAAGRGEEGGGRGEEGINEIQIYRGRARIEDETLLQAVIRSRVANDVKLTGNPIRWRNNDESSRRALVEIDRRTRNDGNSQLRERHFAGAARTHREINGVGWGGVAMTRAFPPPQIRCNSVPGIRATIAPMLDFHKRAGRNSSWNWVKRVSIVTVRPNVAVRCPFNHDFVN